MKGALAYLSEPLRALLRAIEERVGHELVVTSGYRDPIHNAKVGGVPHSEHTAMPAEGADIWCRRSVTRWKLVTAALAVGVRRIGIGPDFVHIGLSVTHPQDVMWTYYPDPEPPAPQKGAHELSA